MLGIAQVDDIAVGPGSAVDGSISQQPPARGPGCRSNRKRASRAHRPLARGETPCRHRPWPRKPRRHAFVPGPRPARPPSDPSRSKRVPQPHSPVIGDHHALAVALGKRRRAFLTPGFHLRSSRAASTRRRGTTSTTAMAIRGTWRIRSDGKGWRISFLVVVESGKAQTAQRYDNESPASLATVNRSICIPSTTQWVVATRVMSVRIGAVGPSRLDAKTARTLPGRFGNG